MSSDQFFKFPAWLLASTLSDRAMILYMLIADRVQASAKNGFTDDRGPYCYYTVREIEKKLSVSHRTAQRSIAELEEKGIITRIRPQGNRTQAFKIYVNEVSNMAPNEVSNMAPNEVSNMAPNEVSNMAPKSEQIKQTRLGRSSSSAPAPSPASSEEAEEDRTEEQGDALSKAIHKIDPTLEQEDIAEIKRRLSKQKGIYNLGAYVRTVIRNYKLEACIPPPEQDRLKPTYNIEEYESTSVLDELDEED